MADKDKIEDFREVIARVIALDFSDFLQQPKWGAMNFSSLIQPFERRLKPVLRLLQLLDLEVLDDSEFDTIRNAYEPIGTTLNRISEFDIANSDASIQRNAILKEASRNIRKIEEFVTAYSASFLFSQVSDINRDVRIEALTKSASESQSKISNLLMEVLDTKVEIDEILKNVREAAANVGVETHATIFETESISLKKQSYWWLFATGLLLVVTICGAAYFYMNPSFALGDMTVALQIIVPKVLLLGLLVSITVWCGRNYRALAHEAAVNRHRANALSTFRTFVDSTNEPEVRNAVLLEATRAIFSQAPSGYLDKSDNSGSDNRITEVVRSFNSATRMTN